jgi:hypothetical protein
MTDDVRLRWAQFYWHAWRDDRGVQECSLIAKGLWIEMLALMGGDEVYGHLHGPNRTPMTVQQLARRTYSTVEEVQRALDELELNGVFSRTDKGVIYNRRMVKDGDQYARFVEAGKRGGRPPNNPPNNPPSTRVKTPLKGGIKPPPNHTESDTEAEEDAESIFDASSAREDFYEPDPPRARRTATRSGRSAAARSARPLGPPVPNKDPRLNPSGSMTWEKVLWVSREGKCWYPDELGPPPGDPRCFIPPDLIKPGDGVGWEMRPTLRD